MKSAVLMACLATSALLPSPAIAEPAPAAMRGNMLATIEALAGLDGGPRRVVLAAALAAYEVASRQQRVSRDGLLTVIDYTRPSTEPRLWVLDLVDRRVLFHELVAHGQNSGGNRTTAFSNAHDSHMSSLGLFVTAAAYVGRNGYSLRLHGLDAGVNDNAYDRAIVVHGAPYVSERSARHLGRLGRSWGCPAVRPAVARRLIDAIKGGSVLFAYGAPRAHATQEADGAPGPLPR